MWQDATIIRINKGGYEMNADIRELSKSLRPSLAADRDQRSDLHNLLDETKYRQLIVISGPPGSGKSALVATYIATRNLPSIWYRLDDTDKNLATFFHYFGIAARETMPHKVASMPDWRTDFSPENTALTKQYFRGIYQHLETPFLVVLDDYQEVGDDTAFHDAICVACRELPPGGRMVIISSKACPPSLARQCTDNMAAIIEPDDLLLS